MDPTQSKQLSELVQRGAERGGKVLAEGAKRMQDLSKEVSPEKLQKGFERSSNWMTGNPGAWMAVGGALVIGTLVSERVSGLVKACGYGMLGGGAIVFVASRLK